MRHLLQVLYSSSGASWFMRSEQGLGVLGGQEYSKYVLSAIL